MIPAKGLVHIERQLPPGVREMRRGPWRPKKHTHWHVALPEGHRFTENPDLQPAAGSQMGTG